MEQQQRRQAPVAINFSVVFGERGGVGVTANVAGQPAPENLTFMCSQAWEAGNWINQFVGEHSGQNMNPPHYMLAPQPQAQLAPPQPPPQYQAPQYQEPRPAPQEAHHFPPSPPPAPRRPPDPADGPMPSFMSPDRDLVNKIAAVTRNGKVANVVIGALVLAGMLPQFWPFGA